MMAVELLSQISQVKQVHQSSIMTRRNKQKSIPIRSLPKSTKTMLDAIVPGHLVTNGLLGSADPVEEPGRGAAKLLE